MINRQMDILRLPTSIIRLSYAEMVNPSGEFAAKSLMPDQYTEQ